MIQASSPILLLYVAAGGVLGLAYLMMLRWSVTMLASGRRMVVAGLLGALRLLLIGVVFWSVVQHGAAPLLAVLLGFVVVRYIAAKRLGPAWR